MVKLPIDPAPVLPEVQTSPDGAVCFSKAMADTIIEREYLLQGALDNANLTIELYNQTVGE